MSEEQNQSGDSTTQAPDPAASNEQAQGGKPKVVFTQEQKDVVNGIVDEAYTRAFAKANQELVSPLKTQLEEAQRTIADLKTKVEKPVDGQAPAKKDEKVETPKLEPKLDAELAQMRAKIEELTTIATSSNQAREAAEKKLQSIQSDIRETRIKEAFIGAAKDIPFFDPLEVFNLIRPELDMDEAVGVVIKNPGTGAPRLNLEMKNMSIGEYLAEFRAKKPYMVRSDAAGGHGSSTSTNTATTKKDDTQDFSKMSAQEFEAYKQRIKSRG